MAGKTITIKIDERLKNESRNVFMRYRLSMNAAVVLFLRETVIESALPFWPHITKEALEEHGLDSEASVALKNTSLRINPRLVESARDTLALNGTALNAAITAFLRQTVIDQRIPFEPCMDPNKLEYFVYCE